MIAPLLLLLLLIAVVIVIRAWTVTRHRAARSADPRCGRCGYIVRGISTLRCPECGSDLREVGIVAARGGRPSWGPAIALGLLWSLVVFGTASVLAAAMQQMMPRWVMATHVVSLSGPSSGAYRSVTVNATGEYRVGGDPVADPYEPDVVVELYLNDGTIAALRADLGAGTFAYRTPGGREVKASGTLDGVAIVTWMKDCGVDTSGGSASKEASQVAEHVRAQPPHRSVHRFSSSSSGYSLGAFESGQQKWAGNPSGIEWAVLVPPALGLIAWVAGLWWIANRHGPSARPAGA
jgi:hypothetical protein